MTIRPENKKGLLTEIVGGECWILELLANFLNVFVGAADEKDRLEMHQFFGRNIVNYIDEENFFLQDLSPRVNHGNDDWEK